MIKITLKQEALPVSARTSRKIYKTWLRFVFKKLPMSWYKHNKVVVEVEDNELSDVMTRIYDRKLRLTSISDPFYTIRR